MDLDQLIKECRQGSAAAQKYLFDIYADRMMVTCCRYVKNRLDAEEAMLDGFYKFFRSLGSFKYQHEGALYAWIKKIMVNECLMQLRKKNVFTMTTEVEPEQVAIPDMALNNMTADEIYRLIIQLPLGYRTVFNLHVIEGLSHKEIGEQLKISEGTSKSQLSKAKQLLQKMLVNKSEEYARRKFN